jgi:tripeptidyl-peptidase I
VRCDQLTRNLPGIIELSEHIDFVYPGVMMAESVSKPRTRRARTRRNAVKSKRGIKSIERQTLTNCSQLVTPQCIGDWYNISPVDKASPNNSMGIYQRGCRYQFKDLDLFFEAYAPDIPQGTRPQNLSIDLATWHYNESDTTISIPDEGDLDA